MSRITEGHLVRHYQGLKGGRDAALLGYLTKPVRLPEWVAVVRSRYAFIGQLNADEKRWAECNQRDLYEVNSALASFRRADTKPLGRHK